MIVKVKARTMNGSYIEPGVELTIASLSFGPSHQAVHNPISTRVQAETLKRTTEILVKYYPNANLDNPRLHIISKDLESMSSLGINPEHESLVAGLTAATLSYIARELGCKEKSSKAIKAYLKTHLNDFMQMFSAKSRPEQIHPDLVRVNELLKEKKYQESIRLLSTCDGDLTTDYDRREAGFLAFYLRLKTGHLDLSQVELDFRAALSKLGDRPDYVKKYYFEYIRFLENIRDFDRPRQLLREFMDRFPMNLLDDSDKVTYYHLLGRAEYARGDYLRALKDFSAALMHAAPEDREERAKILNSSVNCFGDNLFFEEALWMAEQASELRTLLNLPENLETMSCIAGIKSRQNKHCEALEILKQVDIQSGSLCLSPSEQNRLNNYLAKCLVFMGEYQQAELYLEKAEAAGDQKGFSRQIRLLMLLKQGDFAKLENSFNEVFILPENHDIKTGFDRFVLGWAYTFMGEASLMQCQYKDAVLYLNDAMAFFLSDKYVLEAKYASLLAWSYCLPEPYVEGFRKLREGLELDRLYDEYIKKHSLIAEDYFRYYDPKSEKNHEQSNLHQLAKKLELMDDYNYNPAEIHHLFSNICLC